MMVTGASTRDELETWNASFATLVELGPECSEALADAASRFLEKAGDTTEDERLWLVLEAMEARGQPETFALAERALVSDDVQNKEPYITILERLEDRRAIPTLIQVLASLDEDTDPQGFARRRAIRALRLLRAQEAVDAVKAALDDEADEVRSDAIEFLRGVGAREAAPALLRRLEIEEFPSIVSEVASLLADWDYTDALPVLEQLRASDWAEQSEDLRHGLDRAIERLRAGR